ncbi:Crp/Fnr family transcriptional regulator [Glycomyces sp. L485]|uniref:Crp/Fnr family transcriptional regulator n=1 Tax=Glycomyces sp. L485 TaxID=2909235 RepID=UPI001F4BC9B5|nr:Crp/Fnr family transcriptional regulator [Glycomyces sp. L485]MCH7230906.1 Crp/Fnr family transcriptional regulator [Glycomyces sp. L485]
MRREQFDETVDGEVATAPYCDIDSGATLERLVDGRLRSHVPRPRPEESTVSDNPADQIKNRYLAEVDIFRDLTEDELHTIAQQAPMRTFDRGELLFSPRQRVETLFILKTGTVRIFRVSADGRALTTALLEPGTVFGEMVLLGQHMYDQYAEAVEDATLCLMDRADVHKYLIGNPKIAMRVTELLGERLIEAERRLSDTVLKTAPERIASTLHTLAGREYRKGGLRGSELTVKITHEQLADLVGTSRETATKALGALADDGVIKLGRGKITVKKPLALRDATGLAVRRAVGPVVHRRPVPGRATIRPAGTVTSSTRRAPLGSLRRRCSSRRTSRSRCRCSLAAPRR